MSEDFRMWKKKNLPGLRALVRSVRYIFKRPRWFFQREIMKNSIFISEFEIAEASLFPRRVIDRVIDMFRPSSVLDLGCGVGRALEYFHDRGIDVQGVEGSELAISKAKYPDKILQYNLEKELNLKKRFDLIWSFEFVEHIHPKYVDNLLKTFSNHSDKVVVSAAPPGQGGDGHFNEQLPVYWIEKFKQYGYAFDQPRSEELRKLEDSYSQNLIVFERK